MTQPPFDVERLRRNFERAQGTPSESPPDRLAEAQPPRDVIAAAQEALETVRRRLPVELPGEGVKVAPFLAEVERSLQALAASLAPGPTGPPTERAEPEPLEAAQAAVADLDELCAALLGIG